MDTNPSGSFLQALENAGLSMVKPDIQADGRLHRYRVVGDKAGSSNGWYVLHLDGQPFGAFGSWKTSQSLTWTANRPETLSPAEQADLKAHYAATKRARDEEQEKVWDNATARAKRLWGLAQPADHRHPYLTKKGVKAYGIRLLGESLLIPLRDTSGHLVSLQFILPEGGKRFLTGGRKRGCYYAIGRPDGDLCICEGYATAASVYEATGYATACAFDAGNLEPVARCLRVKFPRIRLILCADNDVGTPGNPGVRQAIVAARAVRGLIAIPSFKEMSCTP